MTAESQARQELVRLGRSVYERGLTPGSSGNLSVRIDDLLLVTPTNSCLGRLEGDALSLIAADGSLIAGDKPTKELALHRALYDQHPSVRAVAHLHSTHAVAVSCLPDLDLADVLPAFTAYYVLRVGKLPLVPYHPPGSKALSEAVLKASQTSRCLLLAQHGSIAAADNMSAALDAVEEIETTSRLFMLLAGRPAKTLSEEQREELVESRTSPLRPT